MAEVKKTIAGREWIYDPDGEYNEHKTTFQGHDVVVYSDRDEEKWECTIDDGDYIELEANSLSEACKEALKEVMY